MPNSFRELFRSVGASIRKSLPRTIVFALIGAAVGYFVNVWWIARRYEGTNVPDGAPVTTNGNWWSGGLFWAVASIVVFGIVGYWSSVGNQRFWSDVRGFPSTLAGYFRTDGSRAWVHFFWGVALFGLLSNLVSPAIGGMLAVGVLAMIPSILGRLVFTTVSSSIRAVASQFQPDKEHPPPPLVSVAVGAVGATVALALGFVIDDTAAQLILAGVAAGAALMISYYNNQGGTAVVVLMLGAVAAGLAIVLGDASTALADDGGWKECGEDWGKWLDCEGTGRVLRNSGIGAFISGLGAGTGGALGGFAASMPPAGPDIQDVTAEDGTRGLGIDYDRDGTIDAYVWDTDGDGKLDGQGGDLSEWVDGEGGEWQEVLQPPKVGDDWTFEPLHPEPVFGEPTTDGDTVHIPIDTDGDGKVDAVATDVDGDGVIDRGGADTTGDGQIDTVIIDADGDGVFETTRVDVDGDGTFDTQVTESDTTGDGNIDRIETRVDTDGDGAVDEVHHDLDGDGVTDQIQTHDRIGTDFDGDGQMDQWDYDTDGDGEIDTSGTTTYTGGDQVTGDDAGQPADAEAPAPAGEPAEQPADEPSEQPADEPSEQPADEPSEQPAEEPSEQPADEPSEQPADEPSEQPAEEPSEQPADEPSEQPAEEPSEQPADEPSEQPADEPGEQPADEPSEEPAEEPGEEPKPIVPDKARAILGAEASDELETWVQNPADTNDVNLNMPEPGDHLTTTKILGMDTKVTMAEVIDTPEGVRITVLVGEGRFAAQIPVDIVVGEDGSLVAGTEASGTMAGFINSAVNDQLEGINNALDPPGGGPGKDLTDISYDLNTGQITISAEPAP